MVGRCAEGSRGAMIRERGCGERLCGSLASVCRGNRVGQECKTAIVGDTKKREEGRVGIQANNAVVCACVQSRRGAQFGGSGVKSRLPLCVREAVRERDGDCV